MRTRNSNKAYCTTGNVEFIRVDTKINGHEDTLTTIVIQYVGDFVNFRPLLFGAI